jgi:hypothetical protein
MLPEEALVQPLFFVKTDQHVDNPQQLKMLLLCGVSLLFAILLGWNIGSENYGPLLLGAVVIVVTCAALFSGRFFWVLIIASSFLGGTFPILGAAFTPFQILMMIGVAKFLIGDVVLRRTRIKMGSRFDVLMIAGFMGILTWHGLHDRFGMRFLGSSVWGGHNYVNVYIGLAAFFVVQSIPIKPEVWAKLPYAVLLVASFDLLIAVITTIFPGSIYRIYPFYSAVSGAGLTEILTGEYDVTGRIGAFGNFGFILIMIVLASVPLKQLLNPTNFLRLVAVITGFLATLFSGFRSAVLNVIIGFFAAGIRDLRYGVLALLPLFAAILFALSAINSQVFHLPKQVQRGLALFPGNWDADMAQDAAASNDFRQKLWTLWSKDYFPLHPWVGRGFGFRSEWSKEAIYRKQAIDYQQAVEVGNIHNGLFATVDTFGIVGTVFFVVWNLRLVARTFRVSFRKHAPAGTALRFLALYLAVWIISYWFGALSVGSFLPQEFALAGVFLQLQQTMGSESGPSAPTALKLPTTVHEKLATA